MSINFTDIDQQKATPRKEWLFVDVGKSVTYFALKVIPIRIKVPKSTPFASLTK